MTEAVLVTAQGFEPSLISHASCLRKQYGQTAHDIAVEARHVKCIKVLEGSLKVLVETAAHFSALLEHRRAADRKQKLLIEMGKPPCKF